MAACFGFRLRSALHPRWFPALCLLLAALGAAPLHAQTTPPTPRFTNEIFPPSRSYMVLLEWPFRGSRQGLPTLEVLDAANVRLARIAPGFTSAQLPDIDALRVVRMSNYDSWAEWKPLYGERAAYPERYRGILIQLAPRRGALPVLELNVRAYDAGVAWRFQIPQNGLAETVRITGETTRFSLPPGTHAWATYNAQAEYERVPVENIREGCERPLTLEFPNGTFGALAEAGMDDFARMKFGPSPAVDGQPTIQSLLDSPVDLTPPYTAPWRILTLAKTPGALLEQNHLPLTLSPPSKIEDTSWIKPGKVMREVTLSTKGGKALVDFAVAHNLQYIEYDAGWYGHEYDDQQDARTVTPDPDRTRRVPKWDGLKLQEVIAYAKSKGVGVILYVNRRHLEKQLDELLPLYKSWGVSGLKYGFVNVGSQQWSKWLHDAVRKAAAHQLMVDIHDEYRPTGLSRTWPNLMTQEGILGNEAMPDATHNMTLPFTRGLAGAGDYTICYYTPRIKTTHPHQLALAVIMYSPWQFVFWYDQPSDFQDEPEMRFFEQLPTVWDDTRVLKGEIGKFISVARRQGKQWWLATATNKEARELEIPLDFLDAKQRYAVDLYEEPSAGNASAKRSSRTNVAVHSCLLEVRTPLRLSLPPSGGHAAVLRPLDAGAGDLPACPNSPNP